MYNEKQKEQFISGFTDSESVRKACYTLFNFLEELEEKQSADICEFDEEALYPIIGNIIGIRTGSNSQRMYILRAYGKWCLDNHIAGACDGLLLVQPDNLNLLSHRMLRNPKHLQEYLNILCNPESEETADNTIRCFYWLAYSGMQEEDIFKVQCSDVNLEYMVVFYNGKLYPIYKEAIPAFKKCAYLDKFCYHHPNYGTIKRDRFEGNILIRGFKAVPTIQAMRVDLSRKSKKILKVDENTGKAKTDMQLSYYRVWLSGVFYRLYEKEMSGEKPDFKRFATSMDETASVLKIRKKASEYASDYRKWKMLL